jgi:hypothetical protein
MAITTLILIVNLKLLHCKPRLDVTILKERQLYPTQMLVTLMTFNEQVLLFKIQVNILLQPTLGITILNISLFFFWHLLLKLDQHKKKIISSIENT